MSIFTDKLEMSRRIEEQEKTIALLNSEIAARKKEIVNLNSKLKDTERQNTDYKNRYVNTGLECEFCYTVLQENFSFCPKCGKQINKSSVPATEKSAVSLFTVEDDLDGALIVRYNGFSDKKITIPSSVNGKRVIGVWNDVFKKCVDLEEVIFEEGCQYIGKNAFAGCENLKKLRLPKSLIEIGDSAFSGCKSLSEAAIPPNVRVVGSYAFGHCTNLKKILLPDSLQYISSGMLSHTGISEINIPQSVLHIGYGSFSDTPLKEIELPRNLYSINSFAFDTPSLEKITIHSNVKIMCRDIFRKSAKPLIQCAAGSKAHLYARNYGLPCIEIPAQPPADIQICSNGIIIDMNPLSTTGARLNELWCYIGLPKAASWSWERTGMLPTVQIEKAMPAADAELLKNKLCAFLGNPKDPAHIGPLGRVSELAVRQYWGESEV